MASRTILGFGASILGVGRAYIAKQTSKADESHVLLTSRTNQRHQNTQLAHSTGIAGSAAQTSRELRLSVVGPSGTRHNSLCILP